MMSSRTVSVDMISTKLTAIRRMLKLSVKPSWREYWLSLKVCLIGIGLIGVVAFLIRLLASLIPV
ncbi:MAG: protein translocase SEC61 complex subunit gamma [Candidatus Bathyarchaeota archaeon]|nr:protein translocase SEC61 complex subunit gamma [Candidatus Bathyarchaeota archaeon]